MSRSRNSDYWTGVKVMALLVACAVSITWATYSYCRLTADRYNAALGTHYDALDIALGVHKTARDFR